MHNPDNLTPAHTHALDSKNSQGEGHCASPSSVSREFHNVLADIEDMIKETTSLTGDDLARARDKLNARITTAKASAEAMGDGLMQRARHTASATNTYLHEQPWKAVGAGAAIAFLLGLVIARRS